MPFDEDECARNGDAVAQLLVDPNYGTTLAGYPDTRAPVMWRPGFTGRRVGTDVVVVDPNGHVVATTGQSYRIAGNFLFWISEPDLSTYKRGVVLSSIQGNMFYACGRIGPEATGHLLGVSGTSP